MLKKKGFTLLEMMFAITIAAFATTSIFLFLNQLNRMTQKSMQETNLFFETEIIKNGYYSMILPKQMEIFKIKDTTVSPINYNNYEYLNKITKDNTIMALKYIYENKEYLEKKAKKKDNK